MTPSEFYTTQFYTWEYRGRGWYIAEDPIQLEPPFIPFFRHGYSGTHIDDGKRHTLLSKTLEKLQDKIISAQSNSQQLDYETLAPYLYTEDIDLECLVIKLPKHRKGSIEAMKALLVMLSNIESSLSFELIGSAIEIRIQFVGNGLAIDSIETYFNAFFPDYTAQRSETAIHIFNEDYAAIAVDFGLKHEFVRPLQTPKGVAFDSFIAICAVFDRLSNEELAGIQILFQPTLNRWSESIVRSVTMFDGSSFFIDTPDAPILATQKVQSILYGVTIRAFAQANTLEHAAPILERISHTIVQASRSTFNELIPLIHIEYDFQTRIDDMFFRESHRLGMLLNLDELLTFVHFPGEHIVSKKLYAALRKTKAVPAIAQHKQFILGTNDHNGVTANVTVNIEDRLKHTHIIGATGTGKSTLITQLIQQDIAANIGVIVFDPHGDLIDDIVADLPPDRIKDTVLIDPADIEYPIGLNILEAKSDVEKEVLSSDLVASFRKYATSWGDQMNSILANAILALLESSQGGSLHDLRRFLLEKEFRTRILKTVQDHSVLYYWQQAYPLLKTNSIGPILTRLDTFLRPKSIRNMVVQKTGLDFEQLCNTNKIILCKLSQGLIGKENSYLLGSLILSKLHQVLLRRQQQAIRNPLFIYLDEFQNFMTPSITEMLSGIRKYNVGLILSHQDLQQLQRHEAELQNSVLSNCNTRIVFRVGEPDAKRLQDGFSGFDYTDLQNLGRGEAVVRIEQPQYDCSLETIAPILNSLEQREYNANCVIEHSRKQYATAKVQVEQMLSETLSQPMTYKEEKSDIKKTIVPREKEEENIKTDEFVSKVVVPSKKAEERQKDDGNISTHRYLQTLVKKMAEARGYTAVLESQLPNGNGKVDVLLSKEGKTLAVEICNTTDAEWEMHNIEKCLASNYDMVISLSGDNKQLERIKKKCIATIANFESKAVVFFTPDALFAFLDESIKETIPEETVIKGYRVNVSYDSISEEEMERKRASIAKVVMNSLKKRKSK